MTEPSLALQTAIAARLKADAALTELVPAANIFDRHGLPQRFPCIILGEDETHRTPLDLSDTAFTVYVTLHVWTRETNLEGAKRIGELVWHAMAEPFFQIAEWTAVYVLIEAMRFMRDPGGELGHGVISYEAALDGAA